MNTIVTETKNAISPKTTKRMEDIINHINDVERMTPMGSPFIENIVRKHSDEIFKDMVHDETNGIQRMNKYLDSLFFSSAIKVSIQERVRWKLKMYKLMMRNLDKTTSTESTKTPETSEGKIDNKYWVFTISKIGQVSPATLCTTSIEKSEYFDGEPSINNDGKFVHVKYKDKSLSYNLDNVEYYKLEYKYIPCDIGNIKA